MFSDHDLLRQYVDDGSDAAFAALVARHTDMVYSAARRQVGPGGLAEEVTQATFILLMHKAGRIREGTVVAAWLFKATRYVALNALKAQARRRHHERKAADMARTNGIGHPVWARVAPDLDEAIARLGAVDRTAVVLRFLERRSLADVGRSLGVSEQAAQMRVSRAVEKLRRFFRRRGVVMTAAMLGVVVTAHATQAAPPALVAALDPRRLRCDAGPPVHALASAGSRTLRLRQARAAATLVLTAAAIFGLSATVARTVLDSRPAADTAVHDRPDRPVSLGLSTFLETRVIR